MCILTWAMVISGLLQYRSVNHLEILLARLREGVRETLGGEKVALMFSGGIDSCVIAQLARGVADVRLYTVGMDGAHDLNVAEATARRLNLPWKAIHIDGDDVREGVREIQRVLGMLDPLTISFELPLVFVAKCADEIVMSSGQGADELFGGYARYAEMTVEERRRSMHKDTEALLATGSPMEKRLASHYRKEMRHPFLAPMVIDAAARLPDELIVDGTRRKVALRSLAPALGLDQEAERPKKAAQYGSGIMRCMKAEAKKDRMELADWTASMGGAP